MEIYPKNFALITDSVGRLLLDYLNSNESDLDLGNSLVFCDFPLFREEDAVLLSKILLISPTYGVLVVGTYAGTEWDGERGLQATVEQTEGIFTHIFSKLLKSTRLRLGRAALSIQIDAIVFAPDAAEGPEGAVVDTLVLHSINSLLAYFARKKLATPLSIDLIGEITSVVEGSKGLIRPRERPIDGLAEKPKAVLIKALEEEIRRFDRDQRLGYMTEVFGPQRITGLAGSGKTVVLAMKAALLHVRYPDARIAFVFYTKSLYQHVKQLITRFYRQFDDRDPDWDKLRILHAWGGQINDGFYYHVSKAAGMTPITFGQAKAVDARRPFQFVCDRLLASPNLTTLFEYIFIDEAQDFPPSFLRLALRVAEEEKLVIAYDVFQTIFDVEVPSSEVLFGTNKSGEPAVIFEEDVVLHKCYRNPREVLVCAHAIGFGIYSRKIVQMLESKDHWEDFGYVVESGELADGQSVVITRPLENSPCSISNSSSQESVIAVSAFANVGDEIAHVVAQIVIDINDGGLLPEDIMIISADDRNARFYFQSLTTALRAHGIETNNLQDDSYSLRNFFEKGKVTLATVYKAKGNEAFKVFVIGIESIFSNPIAKYRNTAFAAMTRAKGWLHVSGLGAAAINFKAEVDTAIQNLPSLRFVYPSQQELVRLKRDLIEDSSERALTALDELELDMDPVEYERILLSRLKDVRKRKSREKGVRGRKSL